MPKCPVCLGNDRDMPCAYPSQNKAGCLRDLRLTQAYPTPLPQHIQILLLSNGVELAIYRHPDGKYRIADPKKD
jgi:hypothetical protein